VAKKKKDLNRRLRAWGIEGDRSMDGSYIFAEMEVERLLRRLQTLEEENAELLERADRDVLTGLWNRGVFDDALEESMGTRFCLMLIDIDYFKSVNDTHGHDVGDEVIKYVVSKFRPEFFGRDSIVARWGGEEFAILMRDDHRKNSFRNAAEKVREAVAGRAFVIHGTTVRVPVTISIGVRIASASEKDPQMIFKDADVALRRSKEGGRNQTNFHINAESLKIV